MFNHAYPKTSLCSLLIALITLAQLPAFAQTGPPTIEQVRGYMSQNMNQVKASPVAIFKTEVRRVVSGADSIPIQLYYPSAERNLPIAYVVHGGAFVMLALDVNRVRILCNRLKSIVVCLDYRVAPEHPFPASIDDCYAVWNWIAENAERMGGNRQKISLVGDSAGGVFIGSLQVKRQQEGRPVRPLALVFVNPGVDLRPTAAGFDEYQQVTAWYLNGADPNSPLASPILNENLNGYPPSLIIVSETDVLRPHGILLADKLKKADVATQLVDLPGVGHLAGDWLVASSKARLTIDATVTFLNSVNALRVNCVSLAGVAWRTRPQLCRLQKIDLARLAERYYR